MKKTNAMREIERSHIDYECKTYEADPNDLSGMHAAEALGQPPEQVFKTLVLTGHKTGHFVCCIPVNKEVNLKKAAKAAGDKKAEMLHLKELTPLTGYVRGGCSPVGMKKALPTFIDASACDYERIAVSAGARGVQMILDPRALAGVCAAEFAALTD